jgi:hypothetical protein
MAHGTSIAALALGLCLAPPAAHGQPGVFEGHGDVGTVLHPGSVDYDTAQHTYRITASGENVWANTDAFQIVWRKVSGDISIAADISFPTTGGDPHKKALLMIRQSLDADSAYADVAVHGVGLTSLQSREEKGAATHEVQSNVSAPKRVRITKSGAYFYISVAAEGEDLHLAGGSMRVPFEEPFYVGIGVCAHNKDAVETAVFRNVEVTPVPPALPAARKPASLPPRAWMTAPNILPTASTSTSTPSAPEPCRSGA